MLDFGFAQQIGFAAHVQNHADFEKFERRQHPRFFGAGFGVQFVHIALQIARWRHGNGEPQIIRMIALVIVRHARMPIDNICGFLNVFWRDFHSH